MQTRHVLITLLVAAHVLVALAVMVEAQLPDRSGGWMLFVVVSVGQIGLLSIWTALGRRAAPWRPAALIATILAWSWVERWITGDSPFLLCFLFVATTTVAILVAARGFGLRLFLPGVDSAKNDGPWQFSLSRLFAWTTSLSICLGLLSLAFRHFRIKYLDAESASVCTGIILMSLWLAWMPLRYSYTTFTILVIFALLLVVLLTYWSSGPPELPTVATFCGLELLFLVGSLVVVRVAGYRLGRTGGGA